MLTDILWEEIAAAIYNRIASLITIIIPCPLFQDRTKKTPNKINHQGFNCLLLFMQDLILYDFLLFDPYSLDQYQL